MFFNDPTVFTRLPKNCGERALQRALRLYAHARSIIVKYFISSAPRPRYFPLEKSNFTSYYFALSRHYSFLAENSRIKTFSPADHCYFHTAVTATVNVVILRLFVINEERDICPLRSSCKRRCQERASGIRETAKRLLHGYLRGNMR